MPDNVEQNRISRIGNHCWDAQAYPTYHEIGVRWDRSAWTVMFDKICTAPGQYHFADNGEKRIDAALGAGLSVMAIVDGRWGWEMGENTVPFSTPIWEHLDLWEDFVRRAVEYYRGRIQYWEIINEPPFFWWYPPQGNFSMKKGPWKRAPVRHYAALLKASAKAIRAADPSAKIVAGSGFSDGSFLRRLYELECKDSFDIASVHYLPCHHPEAFARAHECVREVMAKAGDASKPLWDTESGPGGAVIGQTAQTPDEYEALYNVYRHCFACQAGLERYFWFPKGPHHHRDEKGNLLPGARALKTLHELIGDGNLVRHFHPGGEGHAYVFEGRSGKVSVVWSTAPARGRFSGGAVEAVAWRGEPRALQGDFALDGNPLFIRGDAESLGFDVSVTGTRETIQKSRHQPDPSTPEHLCPHSGEPLGSDHPAWNGMPFLCEASDAQMVEQDDHFCEVPTSLAGDVQMAFTPEALIVRARTFDFQAQEPSPAALVQFTLRDQPPGVADWGPFFNSYGLFSLLVRPRGAKILRTDHLFPKDYPAGDVPGASVRSDPMPDGMLIWARIPWSSLGPCRPGQHEPFLMMFSFSRVDKLLDVPENDEPEEWIHNLGDTFIVKKPPVKRWVRFVSGQAAAQARP
ncbi:MAG: hypothetical protein HYU36_02950 [Planctomycetes bacterium]|nr:hypothetical protein [Planctomycetota bacterium]